VTPMNTIAPVERCRVCGGTDRQALFSLGSQFVNDFPLPGHARDGIQVPLELELCLNPNCRLVQLRHTVPLDDLYRKQYWYHSGTTQTMRDALRNITESVEQIIPLAPGDIVLDIGSNDGCLLRSYTAPGIIRVGVEPATNLAEEGRKGLDHFIHDFWSAEVYEKSMEGK
jgi:NDP-4-keto-2,6-dideoxyhexose 3-C-methyltransferase